MTILLNNDDVRSLLTVADCIDVLEGAYRDMGLGEAAMRDRMDLVSPGVKDDTMYILKSMDGLIPNAGVGCVRITSDMHHFYEVNGQLRRTKLPAVPGERYTGLGIVFSTETTEPLMIFTDGALNPTRVAATTALGIKHLARENCKTVALLGCGKQADKQVPAVAAVRDIDVIKCYSPTGQNRTRFARETSEKYGVTVIDVNSAEEAVEGADIILCATNAKAQVFDPAWVKPGMHLGCITQFEIPASVVRDADVAVVHTKTTEPIFVTTHGLEHPEQAGKNQSFSEDAGVDKLPTLGELLSGQCKKRESDDQVTIYLNTVGIGLQFAAVGAVLYHKAKAKGVGREIPTDWLTQKENS
ncbi:MAG: ornithine cyclodeaminase family protein [Rhodospirillales bacterium]